MMGFSGRVAPMLGSIVLTATTVLAPHVAGAAHPQPGSPSDTRLAKTVTATRTGTATIDLGPTPQEANAISLTLTGLSVGTFRFPDNSTQSCSTSVINRASPEGCQGSDVVPLQIGQHTVTITTSADASWRLRAAYVHQVITAWNVNAHGQTYGVPNKNGFPNLIAVEFDRGRTGYVTLKDDLCPHAVPGENFALPVYRSDGTTRIGTFIVGSRAPGFRTVPVSSLDCSAVVPFGG
jgi:hypothetical protein